ncbi:MULTISPECIES: hypothetical protein [unclassified Sphingomonas]|uniref:hypothetical protein n=1 Tax=unclassified Sphingomonas TaxID=196159 RepID=UPI00092B1B8A|nr:MULTISPECIES: hypothetical protein [unclassified Sphingomonas]OJU22563.1 MAG: hypothetical protein BGN95_12425 [Sphingomonas sp. 66-10]
MSGLRASLLLCTGPIAWLVQLCVGAMMTSWPCFPETERRLAPLPGYRWTYAAAIALLVTCALAAALAGVMSWRRFAAARGDATEERTRFIGLWGMCLGAGFALATLITLVAFLLVPQCLG